MQFSHEGWEPNQRTLQKFAHGMKSKRNSSFSGNNENFNLRDLLGQNWIIVFFIYLLLLFIFFFLFFFYFIFLIFCDVLLFSFILVTYDGLMMFYLLFS